MGITPECRTLLTDARRFGPLYANRLANHLPMGLVALDQLGAGPADLQRFFCEESEKLEIFEFSSRTKEPVLADGALKEPSANVSYFLERIRDVGTDAILREWLPRLMRGVGASAFHALIRLAYALEAEDEAELCHALGLWSVEFLELNLSSRTTNKSLSQIAQELNQKTNSLLMPEGIIADKMRRIANLAVVCLAELQPVSISLPEIATFSLNAFVEKDDFTLLHLVTATHAFRLVLPYCSDKEEALRNFWKAGLMAYLTVDHSEKTALEQTNSLDWIDAFALAIKSNDAHTIKLIYSAFCEHKVYSDDRYLDITRRRLRHI